MPRSPDWVLSHAPEAEEAAPANEVHRLVDDATDFAEAAADPDPATLMRHVYAEPG